VKTDQLYLNVICKCQNKPASLFTETSCDFERQEIMSLRAFQFVTDDMLIVNVYFGVCGECGRVVWAKQGPPFKRARAFVPAEA
jgi:hypothetical protein